MRFAKVSASSISAARVALAGALLFFTVAARAVPALPLINTNNIVSVLTYGAVGDGVTTNTTAIQNAINAAAKGGTTNGLAGGTVEIPAGIYMCGPLTLASAVNLQVDGGAILRMLPITMYPGGTVNPANFISGSSLHDIAISGPGAIDGQGAPWWPYANTNGAVRPIMISLSGCTRELIQNITLSNSPMFHIAIGGSAVNSTVQGVTVRAPSSSDPVTPSHNTDACDVSGTNTLVQNCNISTGDDDFTCGGGTSSVLLTNNTYGNGHGVSIGSYTDKGGVSNIMVINCTFNGTDNGIRIKSDATRGGLVQNISYYNLGMTNVHFPIQVYAYYLLVGTPSSITPAYAAAQPVAALNATPQFRNITFSNVNATSVSGYPVGIIWARTELPATNIVFNKVNITGDRNFCLYNVSGAQFIDCNLKVSSSYSTYALFNAQATVTNSSPATKLVTFDGLTTNGYTSTLMLDNTLAALANTNLLDHGPLGLFGSTLTASNNLNLSPNTIINFTLGTNNTQLAVVGNLLLGGTNTVTAGPGFTNGTYSVMSYTGNLSGTLPALGGTPAGYACSLATNTHGLVNLIVNPAAPASPAGLTATATNLGANLNWFAAARAASYNVKRSLTSGGPYTLAANVTATNYADTGLNPGMTYYYVVSATNVTAESANSVPTRAIPLPSLQATNLTVQVQTNNLQLTWPADHLGWRLEIQTNTLGTGLGTNWNTVPGSTNVYQSSIPINTTNGVVFLRLVYP